MGLFTPIYMKDNLNGAQLDKALAKVKALADPEKLANIFHGAPVERVRDAAAWQLAEIKAPPALLEEIALKAPDRFTREKAVTALNNADALIRIAVKDDSLMHNVGEAAIKRLISLGDRDALMRAAMAPVGGLGTRAADAIDDRARLNEIALKSKSAHARRSAISRVSDPGTLIAAASDEDQWVRAYAIEKMDDPAMLAAAAFDPDINVRRVVAERIDDRETLERIALEDASEEVRKRAVMNPALDDPATLAKIAVGDSGWSVRLEAVKKSEMTDQAALAKLALEDKEDHVRIAAIRKLDDAETLAKAAELPDKGWDCPGWEAALRLSQIAPERAVEPLVRLMKRDRKSDNHHAKPAMVRAAAFLEERYRTAGPDERQAIAGLENGWYGVHERNAGCTHDDEIAHFDLER